MRDNTRAGRNAVVMGPEVMRLFENERGAWYETPEEIEAGLEWGKKKALLLDWIRKQMDQQLTERERLCMELYFFEGHTYREIGRITDTNASSAYRAVARSLRKIRTCARSETDKLDAILPKEWFTWWNREGQGSARGRTEPGL